MMCQLRCLFCRLSADVPRALDADLWEKRRCQRCSGVFSMVFGESRPFVRRSEFEQRCL